MCVHDKGLYRVPHSPSTDLGYEGLYGPREGGGGGKGDKEKKSRLELLQDHDKYPVLREQTSRRGSGQCVQSSDKLLVGLEKPLCLPQAQSKVSLTAF